MKILRKSLLLSLAIIPLLAEYQMTLIDKDGIETNQCIKSYSFSNNLESLARQNASTKDIYKEEETLTNKVWFGKAVYRQILSFPITDNSWKHYTLSEDITIINSKARWKFTGGGDWETQAYYGQVDSTNSKNIISYVSRKGTTHFQEVQILVEYTKDNELVSSSENTFKSYLHYILNYQDTTEVITQDLENTGVKFKKGCESFY